MMAVGNGELKYRGQSRSARRTESNHLSRFHLSQNRIYRSDTVITRNHVPAEISFEEPVMVAIMISSASDMQVQ